MYTQHVYPTYIFLVSQLTPNMYHTFHDTLHIRSQVVHLFVLTHALGSKTLLLKQRYRRHVVDALSSLQTICHSVRGRRPFTLEEHRTIFSSVSKKFFRSLSYLQHAKRSERIRKAQNYNVDKPPAKRRRVPHWKLATPPSDESVDTVSSSDRGLPPYFLRSDKIIPHAFVHFTQQVRRGGTHGFFDTDRTEAKHPDC